MSNPRGTGRSTDARSDCFDVLASADRRAVLRIVRDRPSAAISKADLAVELAVDRNGAPPASVGDDARRRALVDCHHRALPALIDAGLLEERGADRIAMTDHWVYEDESLMAMVDGRTDATSAEVDALFASLADERRRAVLAALENQPRAISIETLAREVAACEAGVVKRDVPREEVDDVVPSLVHVHLPALCEAGLVDHDRETGTVSGEGHPLLRIVRLEDDGLDAPHDDLATLRPRDTVVTTGE